MGDVAILASQLILCALVAAGPVRYFYDRWRKRRADALK